MQSMRAGTGRRLSVALTGAVGVLSLVTGITVVTFATSAELSLLAAYVPEAVQRVVSLTGAFTGFAVLASAWGLLRGLRIAWYSAVVLLPVTAVQGVAQLSALSLPLVALSLVTVPVLVVSRGAFTRSHQLTQAELTAGLVLVGVLVYGTVGTYALRAEFRGVRTPLDAFYYTIVTASTVGYGDVTPDPASSLARAFTVSVLVLGTAGFAVALGALFAPAIEARVTKALGRMTQTELELLEDHVLVLGYGDLTEPIITELSDAADFLVVTTDAERAADLAERGYDALTGDPSDEDTLRRARLSEARAVVVASDNDADDALTVLTASQLNPEVPVVVGVTELENVPKLKRAGADSVISPASIGGRMLVESALGNRNAEETADRIMEETEKRE